MVINTIDIYKTRKEYVSLDDMVGEVNTDKVHESRVHMVRGHFKHKKNGCFWWNAFIRNKKTANEESVTQKDYRLKEIVSPI